MRSRGNRSKGYKGTRMTIDFYVERRVERC